MGSYRYDSLKGRWHSFWYNFGWSSCVKYIDGRIPRLAMAVPIVGYLILFNDTIAERLTFNTLASEATSAFGLTGTARLKLVYLGLIALGVANVLYRWRRPYLFKLADNQIDWINRALINSTMSNYIHFHGKIRHSDMDPYTTGGKYYDSEWDDFCDSAMGPKISSGSHERDHQKAHWNEAGEKHESLLRSILTETYFRDDTTTRQAWLVACIAVATLGYGLLGVPSLDLFLKVTSVIVSPLWAS